jgi:hypothetical protein
MVPGFVSGHDFTACGRMLHSLQKNAEVLKGHSFSCAIKAAK